MLVCGQFLTQITVIKTVIFVSMKYLFISLFLHVLLPCSLSAQKASFSPGFASRGDTIEFTIIHPEAHFRSQPFRYAYMDNDNYDSRFYLQSYRVISDTIIKGSAIIPRFCADGVYHLKFYGYSYSIKSALTITGGIVRPAVSIFPSSAMRGEKVRFTVKNNGGVRFTDYTKESLSMALRYPDNSFHISLDGYDTITDSTISGWFIAPKQIKDSTLFTLSAFFSELGYPYDEQEFAAELPDAFSILGGNPQISVLSISPNASQRFEETEVTVICSGTDFTSTHHVSAKITDPSGNNVSFLSNIKVLNDSVFTATVFPGKYMPDGIMHLQVYTAIEGEITLADGFIITGGPASGRITSLFPGQVMTGEADSIMITCSNTNLLKGTANSEVYLYHPISDSYIGGSTKTVNDTVIIFKINPEAGTLTGYYDIIIKHHTEGELIKEKAILVKPRPQDPQIISVSPSSITRKTPTELTIKGVNTHFKQSSFNELKFYNPHTGSEIFVFQNIPVLDDSTIIYPITIYDDLPDTLLGIMLTTSEDSVLNYIYPVKVYQSTGLTHSSAQPFYFGLYPNPSEKSLFMAIDVKKTGKLTYCISESSGLTLYKNAIDLPTAGKNTFALGDNNLNLKPGIYFVTVEFDGAALVKRILMK